MPEVPAATEKWTGKVREVKLGGQGRKTVVVGGEATLPFLHFEGSIPNRPAIAMEINDRKPSDWAPALIQAWGDALNSPASAAKKAVEFGADLVVLVLRSAHPEDMNTGAAEAAKSVSDVLAAVDVPLMVVGPGVAEKDNEVLVAAADAARGQRIALGNCEEKNYRTIAASCIANGHVAIASTPIEINLAKQLNILINDVGVSPDSIIMDPTTGALGYGLEYSYSVMERLRLAALQGDAMTAMPMISYVGAESWRQKETKGGEGTPKVWGDYMQRALAWEAMTALSVVNAGVDILVLRHPSTAARVKSILDGLMKA